MIDELTADTSRRSSLRKAYEDVMAKLRAVEAGRARVSTSGETTTVEISPYPEEGRALAEEWNRLLQSVLTPEELRAYGSCGMKEDLFKSDFGKNGRTIVIRRGRGRCSISDTYESPSGDKTEDQNDVPLEKAESALAPYRHLLGK
jgi:hypothetical protein